MNFAKDWPRHGAAAALLIVSAGCVPPADTEAKPAPRPAVQPVTPRPPLPVPARMPVRSDFALAGLAEQGAVMIGQAPGDTRTLTFDGKPIPVAADGRFLIAFDRDAGPVAQLVATLADGRTVERRIAVAAGSWRLEHINAPYRGSASSDADFERRRPAELAQIAAARNMPVESDGWRQKFRWPVTGRLSGFFGSQRVYQGKPGTYHSGTDVAVPARNALRRPRRRRCRPRGERALHAGGKFADRRSWYGPQQRFPPLPAARCEGRRPGRAGPATGDGRPNRARDRAAYALGVEMARCPPRSRQTCGSGRRLTRPKVTAEFVTDETKCRENRASRALYFAASRTCCKYVTMSFETTRKRRNSFTPDERAVIPHAIGAYYALALCRRVGGPGISSISSKGLHCEENSIFQAEARRCAARDERRAGFGSCLCAGHRSGRRSCGRNL